MPPQIKSIVFALSALAMCSQAQAAGNYVGVGFSPYSLEVEAGQFTTEAEANVIEGYYGFEWNDFFAAEMRLGFGLGSDDLELTVGSARVDMGEVKVTSMFGLYAKPQFKSGGFKAYGLLGYAGYNTETTIEFDGEYIDSKKTADDGISYGLGAGFDFGQHGLALEWKSTKIDGGDISGVAVFYQYQF